MQLGDDQLYCIELTERSYRSAGLPLSKPLRLDHLPRYAEFPRVVRLMKLFTPMVPDQQAYVIGNDAIGIWSSPAPRTRLRGPPRPPPACAAATMKPLAAHGLPARGTQVVESPVRPALRHAPLPPASVLL